MSSKTDHCPYCGTYYTSAVHECRLKHFIGTLKNAPIPTLPNGGCAPMMAWREISLVDLAQLPEVRKAVLDTITKSQAEERVQKADLEMYKLAVEIIDDTVITDSPIPHYDGIHDKYRAAKAASLAARDALAKGEIPK